MCCSSLSQIWIERAHRGSMAWAALLVAMLTAFAAPALADMISYAIVRNDASLKVQDRTVRLFGIHIPKTGRVCATEIRPVRCGSRAARALEFKIQGFVRCVPKGRYQDGSLAAICYVRGDGSILDEPVDLGAFLIEKGLAVALPGAPFRYHTLERIARARRQGIWGFPIDRID